MTTVDHDDVCDRILLVDDDEDLLDLLRPALERQGYEVETAQGGTEALIKAEQHKFELILSDIGMMAGDGFTLVKALRAASLHDGPVILMSGEAHTQRRVRGFDVGADDFVPKPVQMDELLARIKAHLRRAKRHAELKRDSLHDALTGVLNQKGMRERFESYAALLERRPGTLSLLMIDVNDFKAVNDQHGHAVGDTVLRTIGHVLATNLRTSDSVARWGGDEFLILAPEADAETAQALCQRVQALCPIQTEARPGLKLGIALSVGAATTHAREPLEALMSRADEAMYATKRQKHRPSGRHLRAASVPPKKRRTSV
jgi:diguanylate cyclase (GGDEF)-like protein